MNQIATIRQENLPDLVQRAANALLAAKSSAEVLEARDMASVAYTAAKTAGRMARAKEAHDSLLADVYRAQADALLIEARAKMRLADEYDAAQEAGEIKRRGRESGVEDYNTIPNAADVGIRRDQIHEARQYRDAEKEEPGLAQRALSAMIERGEEPTKAKLRRELQPKAASQKTMNPKALWVWGRLKDFERDGILAADPSDLLAEMTEPMRADVRHLAPAVAAFVEQLK